jgi:hypothetical protein
MNQVDIMDAVQQGVENILFKNWRHEGYIDFFTSNKIGFIVDKRKYELEIKEIDKEKECMDAYETAEKFKQKSN